MRLSTRGQYGVRAMVHLALNYDKGATSLREISEKEGISYQYLEQIFMDLRRGSLIKSIRGAKGGYVLVDSPEKVTVGDIIRLLEGPIAPVDCVREGEDDNCEHADRCVSQNVWKKLRDRITEVLDEFTLKDLTVNYQ